MRGVEPGSSAFVVGCGLPRQLGRELLGRDRGRFDDPACEVGRRLKRDGGPATLDAPGLNLELAPTREPDAGQLDARVGGRAPA